MVVIVTQSSFNSSKIHRLSYNRKVVRDPQFLRVHWFMEYPSLRASPQCSHQPLCGFIPRVINRCIFWKFFLQLKFFQRGRIQPVFCYFRILFFKLVHFLTGKGLILPILQNSQYIPLRLIFFLRRKPLSLLLLL